jgi:O-antigen/teichoic acid export membrane protein
VSDTDRPKALSRATPIAQFQRSALVTTFASSVWAVIEYGWYPLLLFVATPWFLHQLGTEQYGQWMLLSATAGLSGLLNAGTGAATIKAVSTGIGRAAGRDAERTVKASLAVAMVGGSAVGLLVCSLFWFAGDTLLSRMGDPAIVQLTGAVAALLIVMEQLDNVFSSAMKGAELFGYAARIEVVSKTVQILVAALVLSIWPRLWTLYASLLVVAVLRLLIKTTAARRLLNLSDLRPSFVGVGSVLHFATWGWLQGIGTVLFGVADRLLVGSLLGASSLSYYSIASQLAMQVHAVTAAGLSVIFPKVSRKLETDGRFSVWRVTRLSVAGNLLLSTVLALLLIALGPTLLQVWIGADNAAPTAGVLPWLVVAYWLLALAIVPYYILLAMGRVRFVGLTVLASGAAAIVATYVTISELGLIGAAAGRGIYAVLSLVLVFPLAQRLIQERNAHRMERRDASPDSETLR